MVLSCHRIGCRTLVSFPVAEPISFIRFPKASTMGPFNVVYRRFAVALVLFVFCISFGIGQDSLSTPAEQPTSRANPPQQTEVASATKIPDVSKKALVVHQFRAPVQDDRSTVKTDSLRVYSEMSTESDVVLTLARGTVVRVGLSVATDGGRWCSVSSGDSSAKLGFVRCDGLEMGDGTAPEGATAQPSISRSPTEAPLQSPGGSLHDGPVTTRGKQSGNALPAAGNQLLSLANRAREQAGIGELQWDDGLAEAAREHCLLMASEGPIAHRYVGEADLSTRAGQAGAHFDMIEENVGSGTLPAVIHDGWMHSPGASEELAESGSQSSRDCGGCIAWHFLCDL